VINKQVR